jgi:type II pantothenate kinase
VTAFNRFCGNLFVKAMILGIDFGASSTKAVLLDKGIVKKAVSQRPLVTRKSLESFLKAKSFSSHPITAVAVTGGKSHGFKEKILGLKPKHVNEINAIGFGAAFLSNQKNCLAVSLGTGTCIVSFSKGKCSHVIGSGLGGGTILGLSKLLLKEANPKKLAALALKGNLSKTDLSVKDIVGKGIGKLPGNATASNLAKPSGSKADKAAAIQNLVAESIAVLLALASKQGQKKAVFAGRTLEFPFVKKRLKAAEKMFKADFSFPKSPGFATALGAAFFLQSQK